MGTALFMPEGTMSVAWVFPGQGSHHLGMALGWAARSEAAGRAFEEAQAILGFDLRRLVTEGPLEELSATQNQQPALLAASVAIARAVSDAIPPPDFVAGHSLGEYSALVVAEALDYGDALRLVRERGRLMARAGGERPGGMAAVLGLADAQVEAVCAEVGEVEVANYNCPGQVVISGTQEGVAAASQRLLALGAKRVVPLAITIAAHSRLMAIIARPFGELVAAAGLRDPRWPVIGNVSAQPLRDRASLVAELTAQMTAPVRWTATVRWLASAGVEEYYEIGPKNVLCDLIRRTLKSDGLAPAVVCSMAEPADSAA